MKTFKASINGKCRNITFEVGKTYTHSLDPKPCVHGFHSCPKLEDVFTYYSCDEEDIVIFEVENLGKIRKEKDKVCSNKIKILRKLDLYEYEHLLSHLEYDSNGNMIKKVYPCGDTYHYEYDSEGNKTKEVHPNGHVYQWEYDSNGNMIKKVYANGNTYQWEYDSNGNMIKKVYANGNMILMEI